MPGSLVQTFRQTLARIAEIEERMASDRAELAALHAEIVELRQMLGQAVLPIQPTEPLADTSAAIAVAMPLVGRKRPIREGSTVGQARRVLRMVGGPLHVDELIKNIEHMTGLPVNKATLVSNLSRYVKNNDTFIRVGANRFGLIDYGKTSWSDRTAIAR